MSVIIKDSQIALDIKDDINNIIHNSIELSNVANRLYIQACNFIDNGEVTEAWVYNFVRKECEIFQQMY